MWNVWVKMKRLEKYLSRKKFPKELEEKIVEYFEHRYQGAYFDEDAILKGVSEDLRLVSENWLLQRFDAFVFSFY